MNNWTKKNSSDGIERAFQCLGIHWRKFPGDSLVHRIDNLGTGGVPFPTKCGHLGAHSPPISRIICPFHHAVCFKTIDQLSDVGANACELRSQLTDVGRGVLGFHL